MFASKIGILAIQGSFIEHAKILETLKRRFEFVRSKTSLQDITHLIIPGGESTTITNLLKQFGLWEILENKVKEKKIRLFGTCAGAIICAYLGMDMTVERNGYGAQLESFTDKLDSKLFPGLKGVFIRAPKFNSLKKNTEVLATHGNEPVLLRQGIFLSSAFHPELAGETRIHRYFLNHL